ncbi:MAG: class I SAM-dependent methyltransferase [Chloroflexota bacterium]|nr:class I SAM-dependent methyltransferase [Chloroflexota bacterium]
MKWVACNLCGSDDAGPLYPSLLSQANNPDRIAHYRCTSAWYRRHYAIVKCRQCGLVYANPRPPEEEVLNAYREVEDPLYLREELGRVLTFRRHVGAMEEVMGPPQEGRRLLDVGCYVGLFLEAAKGHGWEAWGVEPCRWAVKEGHRRGLTILEGTLREASLPAESFDVVTFWDVAEHLTNPRATFAEAWRVLKPGGWIIIQTMNIASWTARLLGSHWPWLMEMHLYYFSPRTLACLLERVGFTPVKTARLGRYLRLNYLASRLRSLSPGLAQGLQRALRRFHMAEWPILINPPDLFTLFARKEGS